MAFYIILNIELLIEKCIKIGELKWYEGGNILVLHWFIQVLILLTCINMFIVIVKYI